MASVKSRQQLEPIVVMHDNSNSNKKIEQAGKCETKAKSRERRQLRVGQAGEAVYKLHMERTRRSHMTANAICEAHLQQQQQKENGMPN